ncbi:MAG: hypothetical protein KA165_04010 [Saprospiraceae bacterium]|nr:hypothetical protein [Saprospiraceae bacterium]
MSQILIVEGNDAIVLSNLCRIRRLPPPTGYASQEKFRSEFVKNAGGFDNSLFDFSEALKKNDYTNIGLIIDANDKGAAGRWASVKSILSAHFSAETLNVLAPKPEGIIVQETGLPTVGIWIMPDNEAVGYLEHFVAAMIPVGDEVWEYANGAVNELEKEKYCRFKPVKKQKALLHTWLAWQEEPGKPFGTALEFKYFDAHASAVQPFLDWMKNTFRLG